MQWAPLMFVLWLLAAPLFADDTPPPKAASPEISAEDLEIIALMETLEIMEMMELMEMIEDMDILLEENKNENQD